MKPNLRMIGVLVLMLPISLLTVADSSNKANSIISENTIEVLHVKSRAIEYVADLDEIEEKHNIEVLDNEEVVYKGMTEYQLSEKLNKHLKSTLSGKGELFASYCLEKGVDPYLAVSIVLLETGCSSNCSTLVKQCNNVGGQHGSGARCGKGPYAKFKSLDGGIKAFVDNLADNYIDKGLTTPKEINTRYASSSTWARKVQSYINKIEKN